MTTVGDPRKPRRRPGRPQRGASNPVPYAQIDTLLVHGEFVVDDVGHLILVYPSQREVARRCHVDHTTVLRYCQSHDVDARREAASCERYAELARRRASASDLDPVIAPEPGAPAVPPFDLQAAVAAVAPDPHASASPTANAHDPIAEFSEVYAAFRALGFTLRWELVATPPGVADEVNVIAVPQKALALLAVLGEDRHPLARTATWLAHRAGIAALPTGNLAAAMGPLASGFEAHCDRVLAVGGVRARAEAVALAHRAHDARKVVRFLSGLPRLVGAEAAEASRV